MSRLGFFKRKVVWIPLAILLLVVLALSFFRSGDSEPAKPLTFNDVVANARDGRSHSIVIEGISIYVPLYDDDRNRSY